MNNNNSISRRKRRRRGLNKIEAATEAALKLIILNAVPKKPNNEQHEYDVNDIQKSLLFPIATVLRHKSRK